VNEDIKKQLEGVDWPRISMELAKYAYHQLNAIFHISGKQDLVPKGSTIEDVVQEAICRFFENNRRNWNPEKVDLIPFLKGIVRSIVSHLADSAYNKHVDRRVTVETEVDHSTENNTKKVLSSVIPESRVQSPFGCLLGKREQEVIKKVRDIMLARCEGDSDYESVILAICIGEDKPREIAEHTGLPISKVYSLNKKWKKEFQEILREVKAHS